MSVLAPSLNSSTWKLPNTFKKIKDVFLIPTASVTNTISNYWSESLSVDHLIDILDNIYIINDFQQISKYIKNNSFLIDLLFEAYSEIKSFFGNHANLHLEFILDPDSGEADLFIIIKSSLDPDKSYILLDALDDSWWVDAVLRSNGKLNIDLEFEDHV